jgi:hypothetical protein
MDRGKIGVSARHQLTLGAARCGEWCRNASVLKCLHGHHKFLARLRVDLDRAIRQHIEHRFILLGIVDRIQVNWSRFSGEQRRVAST